MKRRAFTGLIVSLLIGSVVLSLYLKQSGGYDFEWTMVNVNQSTQQGDAHVIRTKKGKTILIDAGHKDPAEISLLPFLQENKIDVLDIVFISHPHKDHYDGLHVLLENGIRISEIYFNLPDKSLCDQEIPWGCNYDEILILHDKLRRNGVVIKTAEAGQSITIGKNSRIELLYAFDGIETPVGRTDVNDISLIMMVHHEEFKFLFTGDLNRKIGGYLADSGANLSADILKVPHHGAETVAPNRFFEKVSPQHALVPAPKSLWLSDRCRRIRKWFSDNDIPVYVNGLDGNIHVIVEDGVLTVEKQAES